MIKFITTFHDNYQIKSKEEYNNDTLVTKILWNDKGQILYNKNHVFETQYNNGRIHGKHISFYPNGNLHKVVFKNNGWLNGPTFHYYPNGQIKSIGHFKNGTSHGEYLEWNHEGKLIKNIVYVNGKSIYTL